MARIRCLAVIVALWTSLAGSYAFAAEVRVEGVIKAVDAKERTLTVEKKVARGTKELTLEVNDNAGDLASLKVGDPVTFSDDATLEVVTKLITPGKESAWLFYDLACKGVTPEKPLQRISDDEVRCRSFAEAGTEGPYLLVTRKEYEAFLFHCEFYYETETLEGNPFVAIASARRLRVARPIDSRRERALCALLQNSRSSSPISRSRRCDTYRAC